MTTLYVLTNGENIPCKIGIHTGPESKLKSRYITALPNLKILMFKVTPLAAKIETWFKNTYKDKRVVNSNGNPSEWFNLDFDFIKGKIEEVCSAQLDIPVAQTTPNIPDTKNDFIRNNFVVEKGSELRYILFRDLFESFSDSYYIKDSNGSISKAVGFSLGNISSLRKDYNNNSFYTDLRLDIKDPWVLSYISKYKEDKPSPRIGKIVISDGKAEYSVDQNNSSLFHPCKVGNLEQVELALKTGTDDYSNGLAGAIIGGHSDIIEWMLDLGANDYNLGLNCAVISNNKEAINRMLELGANNYNFILRLASELGQNEVVKEMVKRGANDYDLPMSLACKSGNIEIVQLMISKGANNYSKCMEEALPEYNKILAKKVSEINKEEVLKEATRNGDSRVMDLTIRIYLDKYNKIEEELEESDYGKIVKLLADHGANRYTSTIYNTMVNDAMNLAKSYYENKSKK